MISVLEFENVHKSFGRNKVIHQVSFPIFKNETVAILGPNGAGKSTLLSLAFGLRKPDSGSVKLFGMSPRAPAARRRLGVTPQNSSFPEFLRVSEMVKFVSQLYVGSEEDQLLTEFGLQSVAQKLIGALSEGQKRRLSLVCAFVGQPQLVLLDEPTTGLDIEARAEFYNYVKKVRRQTELSILFSTHHLEEVSLLADRVLVLHEGRLRISGTLAEIRQRLNLKKIRLTGGDPQWPASLIHSAQQQGGRWEIWTQSADELVRWLVQTQVRFADLLVEEPSLEEIFFKILAELKGPEVSSAH